MQVWAPDQDLNQRSFNALTTEHTSQGLNGELLNDLVLVHTSGAIGAANSPQRIWHDYFSFSWLPWKGLFL